MKKNSVVSVVRYFILIVVKVKQRSEKFPFNSSEAKQCSERSQRFPFKSRGVKQRSECSK